MGELGERDILYMIRNEEIRKITNKVDICLFKMKNLDALSYKENWLIMLALCDMLESWEKKEFILPPLGIPQHRFENIGEVRGIKFYNDSKSTIMQATLAALENMSEKRVHLFLGGLSKGVDRTESIALFKNKVASVTCFGAEAGSLYDACKKAGICTFKADTLDEAFYLCVRQATNEEAILFSPAGSSYDLFKDYKERGEAFISLVRNLQKNS